MKEGILSFIGVVGSLIANLLGGWDAAMATLVIFMMVDYFTGLVVAGIFNSSPKSQGGALESRAGWKGLARKGATLLIVFVAVRLDIVLELEFIRNAVIIAFIANEAISIVENAGLMGIPIPGVVRRAIEVLKSKSEEE